MAHSDVIELQKLAHALAKKYRQSEDCNETLYELLSVLNARLRTLEEPTRIKLQARPQNDEALAYDLAALAAELAVENQEWLKDMAKR